MPTLETERLILRMFRPADFDACAEACADPEVMRFLGEGRTLSRAEAWRQMAVMVGHWVLRGYGMFAVEERATGELVGRIGFWNPEGWPDFEVGWTLRRSSWGRGYATEGAAAVLRHAFTEMKRPHVISVIRVGNEASVRVAERLGERLVDRIELMGHDTLVYRITREEWERGQAGRPASGTG